MNKAQYVIFLYVIYLLDKRSDDPENIDWFQQFLTINKQEQNLELSKLISGEKDTKVYVKKSYNK